MRFPSQYCASYEAFARCARRSHWGGSRTHAQGSVLDGAAGSFGVSGVVRIDGMLVGEGVECACKHVSPRDEQDDDCKDDEEFGMLQQIKGTPPLY